MQPGSGLLELQILEVQAKIVLAEFLLEGQVKVIGTLDNHLNSETNNYLTVTNCVAFPWRETNLLNPLGYDETYLRTEDILVVYPVQPAVQTKIKLMPAAQRAIFYVGEFIIQANLSMGPEMKLSGAMDAFAKRFAKRFLAITDVSIFPMFPNKTVPPKLIPVALLNRCKVSHYCAAEK